MDHCRPGARVWDVFSYGVDEVQQGVGGLRKSMVGPTQKMKMLDDPSLTVLENTQSIKQTASIMKSLDTFMF